MEVKATAKMIRRSPRKVRLVLDVVRGMAAAACLTVACAVAGLLLGGLFGLLVACLHFDFSSVGPRMVFWAWLGLILFSIPGV